MQQLEPEIRDGIGFGKVTGLVARPFRLDTPDPLDNHRRIAPMWPAMERQGHQGCGVFLAWQQQAVLPEIVKANAVKADRPEKPAEAVTAEELQRQQVMLLQPAVITGMVAPVDDAKTDRRPPRCRSKVDSGKDVMMRLFVVRMLVLVLIVSARLQLRRHSRMSPSLDTVSATRLWPRASVILSSPLFPNCTRWCMTRAASLAASCGVSPGTGSIASS